MKALLASFCLFFCFTAFTQPHFTDSSFGTNGKVIENTSNPYKYVIDNVLQADGKTIVLADAYYNFVNCIVLLRYNTNGTLDNTFSGDGVADSLLLQDTDFYPEAIKLQADGKILVCGSSNSAFVIRYNTNGSLDASFGNNGIFFEPFLTIGNNSTSIGSINNVAVLPNGKIMLLSSDYSSQYDLILTRLNSNGIIDSSFGTNGIVAVDGGGSFNPEYSKIELQADGKMVIGGNPNEYQTSGLALNIVLIRLNANGSIDNTYGTNGRVTLNAGPADYDTFRDMAIQPDGKIVVSGTGSNYDFNYRYTFVARFTTSGTPDPAFGTNGVSIVSSATDAFYGTEGQMNLQQDGKILLAGCSGNFLGYNMAVARLTVAGAPDATFDGDGFATLQVNAYTNYGIAVQQQSDGNVIISGLARNNNNIASITIARLTANGQPDNTLNAKAAITPVGAGVDDEGGIDLQVQPDTKILNIKGLYNGAGYDLCVSRHNQDGTLDNSYGVNSRSLVEIPSGYNDFFTKLLSNGKLMLATGCGDYFSGTGILFIRLNASGKVDSSFGTNGKLYIKTRNGNFVNQVPQVAFQPDGKAVLLYAQNLDALSYSDSVFIARLNADGSYDNTFNGNGKKFISDSADLQYGKVYLQPDNKIIMSEYHNNTPQGSYTSFRRINADGSTDNSFNNGNIVSLSTNLSSIGIQPDGKILLSIYPSAVARLNSNGSLDNTFGTGGISDFSISALNYFDTKSINTLDSGKIVLVGSAYDTITYEPIVTIIVLKRNGLPDSTFGTNGIVAVNDMSETGEGNNVSAIQQDGKILLTGYVYNQPINGYSDYGSAILIRLKAPTLLSGRLYTFTGNGNWSNPANWSGGMMPPSIITAGNSIVISTPAGGQCIIDIPVTVQQGASFTVSAGSTLLLPGNLIIQ